MAARVGVEPTTLQLKAIDSTKAPPCPTKIMRLRLRDRYFTYPWSVADNQCNRVALGIRRDREAETQVPGAAPLPGELMAARGTECDTKSPPAERTAVRHARRAAETPGILERFEEVRW